MEKNARKEMDKFVLEKEEEYREVISYIAYSMFLYLYEEIIENNKNPNNFELGCSGYAFTNSVQTIIKVLENITELNKEKTVIPDTLAVQYYKNMQYSQSTDLTKYILDLASKFGCDSSVEKSDIRHWALRPIIGMVIGEYEKEPLFMELLNKKLVDEFYLKVSYDKYERQSFSIDLNRYFDSVFVNNSNDKPKIKSI